MKLVGRWCLVAGLVLLGAAFARGDEPNLGGRWMARAGDTTLTVEFLPGRRIRVVERAPAAVETTTGTYRIEGGRILVQPDGGGGTVAYPFRLVGGVLEVDDPQAGKLTFRRVAASPKPPTPGAAARPGCRRVTAWRQWICIDQGGIKHPGTGRPLECFRMWVPLGWTVTGGVSWKIHKRTVHDIKRSDLINPAQIGFTLAGPGGEAAITVYPGEPFTDLRGAPAAPMFPRGSDYGGTTSWPVLTPRAYVEQILLPRYFRGAGNARVAAYQDVPALAASFQNEVRRFRSVAGIEQIAQLSFAAGATTVDFEMNGTTFREQFVIAPMYLRMPGMVMWWPRLAWSVRAPRDCFTQMLPSLLPSIFSFKLNALWFLLYQRIVDRNWAGVAAVDATIRKIDSEIVKSRAETTSLIHRQLYPVITGLATKSAPGYAPMPLDGMKNHAVDPDGNLRELPDGQNMNDLPPGWKPMTPVPVK